MAKNTAVKPRFNIFDVIIIVLILASIGAMVARAHYTANAKKNYAAADVEFSVLGVSDVTANAIISGQTVYLVDNDSSIGQILSVEVVPSKTTVEDAEGKLIELPHPDKKDVRGVALLSGIYTDDGFMIDGKYPASAGKTIHVYTPKVDCIFTIERVIPVE